MNDLSEQRIRQLAYAGIQEEDLALLKSYKSVFEQICERLVDDLYAHITSFPDMNALIEKHSSTDRLKKTQSWYFLSLTDGVIDTAFIERRLVVGKIHSRIGLSTEWYLGTYMKYLDLAAAYLKAAVPDRWPIVVHALSKLFNFDSQLVLEAYQTDEMAKVERLADERNQVLNGVMKAVQDLTAMIEELSMSSENLANNAVQTAESQEEVVGLIDAMHSSAKNISSMGETIRDISDQTHLLGLNAAIEAARAGEIGSGFEVVANEVRKLAANSKDALSRITSNIHNMSDVLNKVRKESNETVKLAQLQAAGAEEFSSFVQTIEAVARQLEELHKQD